MPAVARKSVHISGLQSTQSRRSGAPKKIAGSFQSERGAARRGKFGESPPKQSNTPTPPPPSLEFVTPSKNATKLAGINQAHYSAQTKQILARAYPCVCPDCSIEMTGSVARRESVVRCPNLMPIAGPQPQYCYSLDNHEPSRDFHFRNNPKQSTLKTQ